MSNLKLLSYWVLLGVFMTFGIATAHANLPVTDEDCNKALQQFIAKDPTWKAWGLTGPQLESDQIASLVVRYSTAGQTYFLQQLLQPTWVLCTKAELLDMFTSLTGTHWISLINVTESHVKKMSTQVPRQIRPTLEYFVVAQSERRTDLPLQIPSALVHLNGERQVMTKNLRDILENSADESLAFSVYGKTLVALPWQGPTTALRSQLQIRNINVQSDNSDQILRFATSKTRHAEFLANHLVLNDEAFSVLQRTLHEPIDLGPWSVAETVENLRKLVELDLCHEPVCVIPIEQMPEQLSEALSEAAPVESPSQQQLPLQLEDSLVSTELSVEAGKYIMESLRELRGTSRLQKSAADYFKVLIQRMIPPSNDLDLALQKIDDLRFTDSDGKNVINKGVRRRLQAASFVIADIANVPHTAGTPDLDWLTQVFRAAGLKALQLESDRQPADLPQSPEVASIPVVSPTPKVSPTPAVALTPEVAEPLAPTPIKDPEANAPQAAASKPALVTDLSLASAQELIQTFAAFVKSRSIAGDPVWSSRNPGDAQKLLKDVLSREANAQGVAAQARLPIAVQRIEALEMGAQDLVSARSHQKARQRVFEALQIYLSVLLDKPEIPQLDEAWATEATTLLKSLTAAEAGTIPESAGKQQPATETIVEPAPLLPAASEPEPMLPENTKIRAVSDLGAFEHLQTDSDFALYLRTHALRGQPVNDEKSSMSLQYNRAADDQGRLHDIEVIYHIYRLPRSGMSDGLPRIHVTEIRDLKQAQPTANELQKGEHQ